MRLGLVDGQLEQTAQTGAAPLPVGAGGAQQRAAGQDPFAPVATGPTADPETLSRNTTEKSRGTAQAGGARTAEQAARPGARPMAGAPPYRRCAGTTARQAPAR